MRFSRFLLTLLLACFSCFVSARIIQVQVIHRHGARLPLKKSPTDPREEERTGSIYRDGIEQLSRLGKYIRDQYIESDEGIEGIGASYDPPGYVGSFSSNFERTQFSARAFLHGLYPEHEHLIPTMVFNSSEFDWIIRGYAICPKLASLFQDFVKGSEFEIHEKKDNAFVAGLAKKLGHPKEEQNLEHVFNVYDEYNIINSGYDKSERFANIEKLPESDMNRLREIVDWYETTKFSYATHKIHVAGGLLKEILSHANNIDSTSKKKNFRIVEYSAHYPTLLTLWATIRATIERESMPPANKLPEFGAAIIIEVHQDNSSRGDRVLHFKWYQGGDGDPEVEPIAVGIPRCTDVTKGCSLQNFQRITALDSMGKKKFCMDCEADLCDLDSRSIALATTTSDESVFCSVGKRVTAGAIGACVGLTLGLLGAVLYIVLSGKKKRRDLESHARIVNMEQSTFHGEVHA